MFDPSLRVLAIFVNLVIFVNCVFWSPKNKTAFLCTGLLALYWSPYSPPRGSLQKILLSHYYPICFCALIEIPQMIQWLCANLWTPPPTLSLPNTISIFMRISADHSPSRSDYPPRNLNICQFVIRSRTVSRSTEGMHCLVLEFGIGIFFFFPR